jgi:hypothetical protein
MPLPPTPYRPTDYPPKYRPLGYWQQLPEPMEPPTPPSTPPRRRWRWAALTFLLLATVVAHAGIAWADLGGDAGAGRATSSKANKQSQSGSCGSSDDFVDPNADAQGGGTNQTDGTGRSSDPARAQL